MEFRIDGLDDAMKKLNRVKANMQALAGSHQIPASELFPPAFMRQHTSVRTFDALLEVGGFTVESTEDFGAIPDEEWERVVRQYTNFGSWQEMQERAGKEYAERMLLSGL